VLHQKLDDRQSSTTNNNRRLSGSHIPPSEPHSVSWWK